MFTVLRMYADDNIASMYATSMHSDSGYLVTNASVIPRPLLIYPLLSIAICCARRDTHHP